MPNTFFLLQIICFAYIFAKSFKDNCKDNTMSDSNNNELKKNLREELRGFYGAIGEIAQRHGCTREWVRVVLRDEYDDHELLLVCAAVLTEKKAQRRKAQEAVQLALTA